MTRSWPRLVVWQWYISLIQLVASSCVLGFYAQRIRHYQRVLLLKPQEFKIYPGGLFPWPILIPQMERWLAFWIIIGLNNLYIMTIDLIRTNAYLGCVLTQIIINFIFVVIIALHDLLHESRCAPWSLKTAFTNGLGDPLYPLFGISVIVSGFCSLYLLSLGLLLVAWPHSHLPRVRVLVANSKDLMIDMSSNPSMEGCYTPTIFGHPRVATSSTSFFSSMIIIARFIQWPMAILFFRRVRPVETRIYAFTRNSFAVFAIVILIFQSVTALRQAQNEVRTRATTETCLRASPQHRLMVLSDQVHPDLIQDNATQDDINITISAILNNPNKPYRPYTMMSCNTISVGPYRPVYYYEGDAHAVQELFDCPSSIHNPIHGSAYSLSMYVPRESPAIKMFSYTYRVQLQLAGRVAGGRIYENLLPRIWLVNAWEFGEFNWSDTTQVHELNQVRKNLLPLVLVPGYQITSEANLITRRFIKSSITREIFLNSKPVYKHLSLYPIVQLSAIPLNVSDARLATADIRITLNPGHMQYATRTGSRYDDSYLREEVCDFIEDYRSGTVLDVVGSVGGLFALLQAAHLLLFGRPLFWGLAGSKTISPFGLLGRCSSRNFKRRLREEYHTQSDEESTHTIQIVKFLRDFVIDFGPADLESVADRPHESRALSVKAESDAGDENEPDSEIPLIPLAGRSHDTPIHSGVAQSPSYDDNDRVQHAV